MNKRTDTVIRELLKLQNVPEEDINHWEERVVVGIQRRQAYSTLYKGKKMPRTFKHKTVIRVPVFVESPLPNPTQGPYAPLHFFHPPDNLASKSVLDVVRERADELNTLSSMPKYANNDRIQRLAQVSRDMIQDDKEEQEKHANILKNRV